jgi:cell division septation protein DedD
MLEDRSEGYETCDIPAEQIVNSYIFEDTVLPPVPETTMSPLQAPSVNVSSTVFTNLATGTGVADTAAATAGLTPTETRFTAQRFFIAYETTPDVRIEQQNRPIVTVSEDRTWCMAPCAANSGSCRGVFIRWIDTTVYCTLLASLGTPTPSNPASVPLSLTTTVSESWYVDGQTNPPASTTTASGTSATTAPTSSGIFNEWPQN